MTLLDPARSTSSAKQSLTSLAALRGSGETTRTRVDTARHNEELVAAEDAIAGERIVTWVRLIVLAMLGVSQKVATDLRGGEPDPAQNVAVALYAAFSIGALWRVHRIRRPEPRQTMWLPLAATVVDFAFMGFMGLQDIRIFGATFPEKGAAIFALLICYSVLRFSWVHVFVSTLLACGCYVALHQYEVAAVGRPPRWETFWFVLASFTGLGFLMGQVRVRARRNFFELRRRDNLTRFLSPQIAERVMQLGDQPLAPVQREVTVLFTDIRGFTTLSERLQPQEVLELLHEHLGGLAQVVKARDGMVNKYLGDGLLAVWGVPDERPEHALQAVRAALDMARVVAEQNAHRGVKGLPELSIGVGIHTGQVAAGMLGGADLHEYTVIGDAVNVASRVEGLTRRYEVPLLISEATHARLGEAEERGLACRPVGSTPVKGRAEPVTLFAVETTSGAT